MENMGYKNMQAVYDVNRAGRMAIRRGDNMTLNKNAELVLMFMASQTYDWDSENNCPPKKLMDKKVPCRYYTLGWRAISDSLGMVMLTPEQAMGGNAEAKMKTRENSIQKSISDAWVFLRDRDIIKTIEPASLGKNAGFLLLLGDDAENAAVERWARECLGV